MTALSIVLLTYNRRAQLQRTLDQLLPQCSGHEILVCDNASSDGTLMFMTDIAARYPNIRYRRNAINVGYARNLFGGFAAASGAHVLFLADDDIIPDGFIAEMISLVEKYPDAGLIIPNRRRTDDGKTIVESSRFLETEFLAPSERALREAFTHSGAVPGLVVRTAAVRNTDWMLDGSIYPQVGLACHLAARDGLVLASMQNSIICLGADGIAARIRDAMNRPDDYGVIERACIAETMADRYPALLGNADILKRSLWGWALGVFDEMRHADLLAHARLSYLPTLLRAPTCHQSASFLFLWLRRARHDRGFLAASLLPVLRYMPRALISRRFFASLIYWLEH